MPVIDRSATANVNPTNSSASDDVRTAIDASGTTSDGPGHTVSHGPIVLRGGTPASGK